MSDREGMLGLLAATTVVLSVISTSRHANAGIHTGAAPAHENV